MATHRFEQDHGICCSFFRKRIAELSEQLERNDTAKAVEEKYASQIRTLKMQAEEHENQLRADFKEKLTAKSNELLDVKQQAAKQLAEFDKLKQNWIGAKNDKVATLEQRHKLEIESLVKIHEEEVCTIHIFTSCMKLPKLLRSFQFAKLYSNFV